MPILGINAWTMKKRSCKLADWRGWIVWWFGINIWTLVNLSRHNVKQWKSGGVSFLVRFWEMHNLHDVNQLLLSLFEKVMVNAMATQESNLGSSACQPDLFTTPLSPSKCYPSKTFLCGISTSKHQLGSQRLSACPA